MDLQENEVLNDLLGFDGMKIIQRNDMLNFSLDSILLANFVSIPKKTKRIIEVGTGNAPIPLFLSMRTNAEIFAMDIQVEAVELARRNIALNGLESQIQVVEQDIRNIKSVLPPQCAEVVLSNPPFFKTTERRQLNDNKYLQVARHEVMLSLEELLLNSSYLLNNNGYFAMVHRPDRFIEIIDLLRKHHLEPKRVQFVHPKKGREANILLVEARKSGQPGMKILPPLIAHTKDGEYHPDIQKIFKEI